MADRMRAIQKMIDEKDLPSYASAKSFRMISPDIEEWKPKEGPNYINIIPPTDPEALFGYKVFVHYRVGGGPDHFLCPKSMHNDPCPVCEERQRLIKKLGPNQDYTQEIKDLFPSARVLYMIVDTSDEKEIDKGVQVWMAPHDSVQKKGIAPLCNQRRGKGGPVDISDPKLALDVYFTKEGKQKNDTKYYGFSTVESKINAEEFYNERPDNFEDILIFATYEDIKKCFDSGQPETTYKVKVEMEKVDKPQTPVDVPTDEAGQDQAVPPPTSSRLRTGVDRPLAEASSSEGEGKSEDDRQEALRRLRQDVKSRSGIGRG
jgi:hypothetical protein